MKKKIGVTWAKNSPCLRIISQPNIKSENRVTYYSAGKRNDRGSRHKKADIRTKETWEQTLEGVDIIYHFAAQTSGYVAEADPYADLQANVVPMLNMLETSRDKNLNPIILFSGTVTQAGIAESLPVDETCKDMPIAIYDIHKLMAEKYLEYYCRQRIVRGATLRLANVYGPSLCCRGLCHDTFIFHQCVWHSKTGGR